MAPAPCNKRRRLNPELFPDMPLPSNKNTFIPKTNRLTRNFNERHITCHL
ncbi:hypothetical protein UUU_34400 [Klebsiella pneumoniae subsp. pneumoniae DSM 30104 = JCM 1662 = NBRC 14940]|nr:hypothetical protein UUU_34400 [Klebsiella pneumoniae subsp. pneumoniae DSM 30104 = JCM 1662 = NBRC 14940]